MNSAVQLAVTLGLAGLWVAVITMQRLLNDHTRAIRALQASLTAVQSVGKVSCPRCLGPLAWVPWDAPADPSWWCAGCHEWIGLEPARSGESLKIDSGRTTRSPNDHAGSHDTQTTQTRETGVARE